VRKIKLYVSTPSYFVRPKNTDWLYTRSLARLPEFHKGLEVALQNAFWPDLLPNVRYLGGVISRITRIKVCRTLGSNVTCSVSQRDIDKCRPDVVFAYAQYPRCTCSCPFVFTTGVTDRAYLRSQGRSDSDIEHEITLKQRGFLAAAAVFANSRTAVQSLREMAPESAHKVRYLPFFTPDVKSCDEESIVRRQRETHCWELLFVGREAKRKGLPELIEALNICASERDHHPFRLTVVSTMSDGLVDLTARFPIQHFGETSHGEVVQLMRSSHMFLMPSHFESYGWVYLEALANGAIPLACDRPVQREILENGRFGLLCKDDPLSISNKLIGMLSNPLDYAGQALRGRRHWLEHYSPVVVAGLFYDALLHSVER
jgi:glycosyltransferase involved in cell wall biosynthesis